MIALVMLPVVVALVPLVFHTQLIRVIAAVLIGGFVVISGSSIGLFYMPAAIMMLLAACVADTARLRDAVP